MRFFARIKPGSTVDRAWRKHNRVGGGVSGVPFRLEAGPGSPFVSAIELTDDEVAALRGNDSVELQSFGMLGTIVDIMRDTEVDPKIRIEAAKSILDTGFERSEPEPESTAPPRRARGRG